MKKYRYQILLLAIITLGFFFRLYSLDRNPPSLNWDEISHGYNAYSILKTGNDEWGNHLPLIFRAYGDYKLPVYIYLTALPVALFGLNIFSVRLISVLSGVGLVLLSYFIGKQIVPPQRDPANGGTKNKKQSELSGLFSAFLCAITPWSLFLSRVAVEANLAAFFFALGIYGLLLWLSEPKVKYLVFSLTPWWLAVYTYNSARIVMPLFILFLFVLILKRKLVRQFIILITVSLLFILPLVLQLKNNTASARYNLVTLIDQGMINRIEENRLKSKLPKPLVRFVYNRPTAFITQASINYIKNLSPKYLFFRGGSQYQFSLPDHELLYLVSAPFLLVGLFVLLKQKSALSALILLWIVSALSASAITRDAPHVLRSVLLLPLPMILAGTGVVWLKERINTGGSKLHGRLIIGVVVFALVISFCRWWNDYQTIYPKAYSWSWQYGYKEVSTYIKDNYDKYNKIYFTKRYGEPHEFLLFYLKYDPVKYQADPNKKWDYHANWYWVDAFDKFEFINDWEVQKVISDRWSVVGKNKKTLLVTSPGNVPSGFSIIKTINFLDDKPAFEIYESNQ